MTLKRLDYWTKSLLKDYEKLQFFTIILDEKKSLQKCVICTMNADNLILFNMPLLPEASSKKNNLPEKLVVTEQNQLISCVFV